MICFPNAKINIGLNLIRKREDGYHDIETVMYPLKGVAYDILEIISQPNLTLNPSPKGERLKRKVVNSAVQLITSGIPIDGENNNNLCVKAYNLIAKDYPLAQIKIYLHKAIPIGAGLGGGSADAAFFIRLLNDTFKLGISWGEMHHYARQLGSDCSFFISNQPAFAEGRGEMLESVKLDLSNYFISVIYPNVHVKTAEAYKKSKIKNQKSKESLEKLINLPIDKWKNNIHNDFEDSVFLKYPQLQKIKEKLYSLGALYASLSGSGSALYGIFVKEMKMKKHFAELQVFEGSL